MQKKLYNLKQIWGGGGFAGSTLRRSTQLWFSSHLVILQGVLSTGFTLCNCALCNHCIVCIFSLFRFVTAFLGVFSVPCEIINEMKWNEMKWKHLMKYFCLRHCNFSTIHQFFLQMELRLSEMKIPCWNEYKKSECFFTGCFYKFLLILVKYGYIYRHFTIPKLNIPHWL